jgi:hypothetical protein
MESESEAPAPVRQQRRPAVPGSGMMDTYLSNCRQQREALEKEIRKTVINQELLEAEDSQTPVNPLFDRFQSDEEAFYEITGFSVPEFGKLYDLVETELDVLKRGRARIIGPLDSLLLFLHWLRTANAADRIASAFSLKGTTLASQLHKVAQAIHRPLVEEYITAIAAEPLRESASFPRCGLIVDATVQKRGRPVGEFADAKKYFSGKHWIYCLKSQVITNRAGLALHIVAGVPGSVHDFKIFKDNSEGLAEYIRQHHGEATKILADKGYIGPSVSPVINVFTPKKPGRNNILSQSDLTYNEGLSSARVVVENFFGRLSTKFHIMVRRWAHEDEYYPIIFEICCALTNFDLLHSRARRLTPEDGVYYRRLLSHISEKGRIGMENARIRTIERNERKRLGKPVPTVEEESAEGVDVIADEIDSSAQEDDSVQEREGAQPISDQAGQLSEEYDDSD